MHFAAVAVDFHTTLSKRMLAPGPILTDNGSFGSFLVTDLFFFGRPCSKTLPVCITPRCDIMPAWEFCAALPGVDSNFVGAIAGCCWRHVESYLTCLCILVSEGTYMEVVDILF